MARNRQSDPEAGNALVESGSNPTAADEVPEPVPETALATKKAKAKAVALDTNGSGLSEATPSAVDGKKADKEAATGSQNGGGTGTEVEPHGEAAEGGAGGQGTPRSFEEMQNLYPNLASWVEKRDGRGPEGEDLKAAIGCMDDETASAMEASLKEQRKRQAATQVQRRRIMEKLLDMLVQAMV